MVRIVNGVNRTDDTIIRNMSFVQIKNRDHFYGFTYIYSIVCTILCSSSNCNLLKGYYLLGKHDCHTSIKEN